MKVKKLEWKKEKTGHEYSVNQQFLITYPNDYVKGDLFLAVARSFLIREHGVRLGNFKTLAEAKQACQDHYESFILSQIEEPKVFDPTLLGFKEFQDDDETMFSFDYLKVYQNKKDPNIYLGYSPENNYYALCEYGNKNHSVMPFESGFFQEIKIPDHDFGVTLISQFLGVE